MATKKKLKQYARNLEALLYLNSNPDEIKNLIIIASNHVSLETKIDVTLSKLMTDYQKNPTLSTSLNLARLSLKNKENDI